MKKQILFLAMFTVALIFAGTNNVFGQQLGASSTTVPPISCADPSDPVLIHNLCIHLLVYHIPILWMVVQVQKLLMTIHGGQQRILILLLLLVTITSVHNVNNPAIVSSKCYLWC